MLRPQLLLLTLVGLLGCIESFKAAQTRAKRGAPDFAEKVWNRAALPFTIENKFDEEQKAIIRAAIQTYRENTCVNFEENYDDGTGKTLQYTLDTEGEHGCFSDIGDQRERFTGNQPVWLDSGCMDVSGVQHETMHALGFRHTQTRPDRDQYIKVDDDVQYSDNYRKLNVIEGRTTDYGIPYEFYSILHYGPDRLKPLDLDYLTTTKSDVMIFNDWKLINLHYKCNETCSAPITCQNGGYQHPRKCDECVCPQFHKGQYCQEELGELILQRGVPKELHKEFLKDMDVFRSYKRDPIDPTTFDRSDALIIKAPEGTRIRVNVVNINDTMTYSRQPSKCHFIGLEIVDRDLTTVGKRFCLTSQTAHSFLSTSNVLGYVVFQDPGHGFAATVTFTVEDSNAGAPAGIEPSVDSVTAGAEKTTTSQPGNDTAIVSVTEQQQAEATQSSATEPPKSESSTILMVEDSATVN